MKIKSEISTFQKRAFKALRCLGLRVIQQSLHGEDFKKLHVTLIDKGVGGVFERGGDLLEIVKIGFLFRDRRSRNKIRVQTIAHLVLQTCTHGMGYIAYGLFLLLLVYHTLFPLSSYIFIFILQNLKFFRALRAETHTEVELARKDAEMIILGGSQSCK